MIRPIVKGEILAKNGSWINVRFLVDTGADRTVLSADILAALEMDPIASSDRLSGVGGMVNSVMIGTELRLADVGGTKVVFKGQFAGFTDVAALDMSVLGRDLLNLFALIVDRPGDTVCLIWQAHGYVISTR